MLRGFDQLKLHQFVRFVTGVSKLKNQMIFPGYNMKITFIDVSIETIIA